VMWTWLIHSGGQVIILPRGWRRRVAWFVRPSKKQSVPSVEGRRMRDTI
jgi:hypothetical protein